MKTVKYVAEKGCKVKVAGEEYFGDKVIPVGDKGLNDEEIKNLLDKRFIRKIELDESGSGSSNTDGEKALEKMNKEELFAKAVELEIPVDESMTKAQLLQAIIDAEAKQ